MTREEALKVAKPILFNTDMVRAIQDGKKTVTRRTFKPKFTNTKIIIKNGEAFETVGTLATTTKIKPLYQVGDILYVREAWQQNYDGSYSYRAGHKFEKEGGWKPSIHMPKEAARIFLRVTNISLELVEEITEEQALKEGFLSKAEFISTFLKMYSNCTESDWVWAIEFEIAEVTE